MFDMNALVQTDVLRDGIARSLALAKAQVDRDCATLGQLHARHVQLLARRTDPEVAAGLLALEAEIGQAVNKLATSNAHIARLRQAMV